METNYMQDFSFIFYEYNPSIDKYVMIKSLPQEEVMSYIFTANDFLDSDDFTCEIKMSDFIFGLIPQNEEQFQTMNPLIIGKKLHGSNDLSWFSFITQRQYLKVHNQGDVISFTGVGFTAFNDDKIANANTNFNNTGEELPDDFGMYVSDTTFDKHLEYLYNIYINPLVITYGKRSTVKAPHRRFKGLGKVNINVDNKAKSKIRFEQKPISDAMSHICDVMGQQHVTKQSLIDGKIVLDITKPKFVDKALLNKLTDVSQRMYQQVEKVNFIYGYGFGNNSANVYKDTKAYFTTIETAIDLSFVGKQNNTYVINTAKTMLSQRSRARITAAIKIISKDFFTKLFVGDCLKIDGVNVRITTIREINNAEDGLSYDVELNLVDDNGKSIIVDTDEITS